MRRNDFVQCGKEHRVLPSFMGSVHTHEGVEIIGEVMAILLAIERMNGSENPVCHPASRLVDVHPIDPLACLSEAGKQVVLSKLLVVVLNKFPDDTTSYASSEVGLPNREVHPYLSSGILR